MKILVIGGGAREHALIWCLARSPRVTELVCAPGNPGIATLARCLPLHVADIPALKLLAASERPGLVVIGPEVPLALGAVDALQQLGLRVFGPTQAAARLETSKAFAKEFMRRWHIPTAAYAVCNSPDIVHGALEKFPARVVVKADGLAAGKGVVICETHAEALAAADAMFSGSLLGTAASSILVEEMLEGPEISFFALCDGTSAVPLALAQDHKRVGEGDTGPNTGGMGAYSTDTLLPPKTSAWILENIAQRVVDGMSAEATPFTGILFIGLMMTSSGPRVLEFNTRFGDPETETILLRLETDLVDILEAAVEGRSAYLPIRLTPGASACVIAASAGYPGSYESGKPITGLAAAPSDALVFQAGTTLSPSGELLTAGGRVLAVTAAAASLPEALAKVYATLDHIHFPGMQYRRDIGWRALL